MLLLSAKQIALYRDFRLLFCGVDLEVSSGQIWQIEGRNGSGKSSLMRILAGLLEADEGDLKWHAEADQQLLFIGHQLSIKPSLTAIANLQFLCAIQQQAFNHEHAVEVLSALGLKSMLDEPLQHFSAGQQRRVALARLWLQSSSIWILDEPFTSLDTDTCLLLERKIDEHRQAGGAVILSSHQALKTLHVNHSVELRAPIKLSTSQDSSNGISSKGTL